MRVNLKKSRSSSTASSERHGPQRLLAKTRILVTHGAEERKDILFDNLDHLPRFEILEALQVEIGKRAAAFVCPVREKSTALS